MKSLERIIVSIGALDLAYIAWIAVGTLGGSGLNSVWQSTVAFGLPLPGLQFAAIVAVYLAILVCGFGLVFRCSSIVWLNYLLFPLRVALVLPTLFPFFAAISAGGAKLHPLAVFALLVFSEMLRIIIVHRWHRAVVARHPATKTAT